MSLSARDDWFVRWISMQEAAASTDDVLSARLYVDRDETKAKVTSALKRLENKGLLKSAKDGRELRWAATRAGEGAVA